MLPSWVPEHTCIPCCTLHPYILFISQFAKSVVKTTRVIFTNKSFIFTLFLTKDSWCSHKILILCSLMAMYFILQVV